ncbi:hypothetical protein B0J14DRAFT_557260 [Halenospora varia]|nr:hypothetical protein B0J14DRAFT_557260 [Halenospora varia]
MTSPSVQKPASFTIRISVATAKYPLVQTYLQSEGYRGFILTDLAAPQSFTSTRQPPSCTLGIPSLFSSKTRELILTSSHKRTTFDISTSNKQPTNNQVIMAPKKKLTSMQFLDKIKGDSVDIYVGPQKKHYRLPKDLLRYYSGYFDRCFNGPFIEGQTQKLTLDKDKIEDFEILAEWMLRGDGVKFTTSKPGAAGYEACIEFAKYTDKYELGEACEAICDALKNIAMEGTFGLGYLSSSPVQGSDIDLIYRITSPENPLRAVFTNFVLSVTGLKHLEQFSKQEQVVEGYAANLLQTMRKCMTPGQPCEWKDPFTTKSRYD